MIVAVDVDEAKLEMAQAFGATHTVNSNEVGNVGKYILDFLSISIAALMIAGGILMLILGVEMVREGDKPRGRGYQDIGVADVNEEDTDVGIVPIGIPMLAGPGSISLVILLFSKMNSYSVIASIILVIAISWLMFLGAPFISKAMGEKGAKVMTRIMGLLVAGFAIQFMLDGILEWYLTNF